ncbi:uncharacterized protein LOC111456340 [Cucurbita moschata]|uniref:Uncharacterized protein LOC111456340 n=1 Tax=Cucurbita moschata TaxID=3662 RepID=A0A6J1GPM4_CUCMO|nr:uncharacterized protein LOC111456340 [Cucurbita moschata]
MDFLFVILLVHSQRRVFKTHFVHFRVRVRVLSTFSTFGSEKPICLGISVYVTEGGVRVPTKPLLHWNFGTRRARLVVFPIRGRNWCFSRSIDLAASDSASSQIPSTLKDLWTKIPSSSSSKSDALSRSTGRSNAEIFTDFISFKMNKAWTALEKAPDKSFKNKLHGIGLMLLSRVTPSEIFLKSITKDITSVEITYPSSLNPRLVRRRLRHIALRGIVIHKKYFYGSVSMLPLTSTLTVLPLPNIPFFRVLFRTYSHWRALKVHLYLAFGHHHVLV